MTINAADSIKVLWTGTGTGTMTLGAAVAGYQSFTSGLNGLEVSYLIEHQAVDTPERENGKGTYNHSAGTLTRDTITYSTNGNALVSFSAGTKHVSLVILAVDLTTLDTELAEKVDDAGAQQSAAAYIDGLSGTHDATTVFLGNNTFGTPPSAGGGGGGLTAELDSNTSITVGSATDGEHHILTSDSSITLTLDAQATAGIESAFTPAGSGVVTVQMEGASPASGAGYWVPGDDIGGTPATTSFTLTGYGYFLCLRNTGGDAAEWLFIGSSTLTGETGGDLRIEGGNLFIQESADDTTDVAGLFQIWSKNATPNALMGTDDAGNKYKLNGGRVITSASGSLTYDVAHGNTLVTSGNVTIPNASTDVGFTCTLIAGGAHTVTFNSLTSAAMASGDVMSVVVQSTTIIKAVLVEAADLVSFT